MNKVERYEWSDPGDQGEMRSIPVGDLCIDHKYQREEVSEGTTRRIARGFLWSKFGVLSVMRRDGGRLVVVDGQQRLLAARLRGDIKTVPCIVFNSIGRAFEADRYVGINSDRTPLRSQNKFTASALAGHEPQVEIAAWLRSIGMRIVNDGKSVGGLNFPTQIVRTWKMNKDASKEALLVLREIAAKRPMNAAVHNGLFHLEAHGIATRDHVESIRERGGIKRLLNEIQEAVIRNGRISADARFPSEKAAGLAILDVINEGRRSKIRLPDAAQRSAA